MGSPPGANLNPERAYPSPFQAIRGSALDLAGKNQTNPIASVWAAQLMLDFSGEGELSTRLMQAIEAILEDGKVRPRDVGGRSSTNEVTDALRRIVAGKGD